MNERIIEIERATRETRVRVALGLSGTGHATVTTGLGFLDHMLTTLGLMARWDLELAAEGDLNVDDHHTVEDCALTLGQALDTALGDRDTIARFGHAYAPLDEALARCVVDLGGRPWARVELGLAPGRLGQVAAENLSHFFVSLAIAARAAIHIDLLAGANNHHRAEAAFKATGLALRQASQPQAQGILSSKGVLT